MQDSLKGNVVMTCQLCYLRSVGASRLLDHLGVRAGMKCHSREMVPAEEGG